MSERPVRYTLDNGDVVSGAAWFTDKGATFNVRFERWEIGRVLSPDEIAEVIRVATTLKITVAFVVPAASPVVC